MMAQIIIRNIDDHVLSRLHRRARHNRRTMEQEVREILLAATGEEQEEKAPAGGLGTEIASLFAKIGLDADIPELRGHNITLGKSKGKTNRKTF